MRFGLVAILLLAAVLRVWRLDDNGWGNEYYDQRTRPPRTLSTRSSPG